MNFGEAVELAKAGKRVARSGWNGSGMYAVVMKGYQMVLRQISKTAEMHNIPVGSLIKIRPYWVLMTAQWTLPLGHHQALTHWQKIG